MTGDKISSLGGFLNYVRDVRENLWRGVQGRGTFWRSLAIATGGPQRPSGKRGGDASIASAGAAVVGARIVIGNTLIPDSHVANAGAK
jgi:hypothetical protein